jgi:hypothetical protein
MAIDKFTKCIEVKPVTWPKSSAPMGWYSTLSRSDCTMLLTLCPVHSRGCVLNPPSRRDSHPISWSMPPKLFYLPMSCGTRRQ